MASARETDLVTVAAIRTNRKKPHEYLFHERERIFSLSPRATDDEQSARRLKAALGQRQPVRVTLDAKRGLIQRVNDPTKRELVRNVRQARAA